MPRPGLVETYTLGGQTFKVGDYFQTALGQKCRIIGLRADGSYSYAIRISRSESVIVPGHIRDLVTILAVGGAVYGTLRESPRWYQAYARQIAASEARNSEPEYYGQE